MKLSDRLQALADYIDKDDTVADIGTDHGYIPIWLTAHNQCAGVILSDINGGPLEKAGNNLISYFGKDRSFDIRQGSGLSVLMPHEVNAVIIAGMGGLLIRDILSEGFARVSEMKKLILQPRNNVDLLRKWLKSQDGIYIYDERIVMEAGKYCEIIAAAADSYEPDSGLQERKKQAGLAEEKAGKLLNGESGILDEISGWYLLGDTVSRDFLKYKYNALDLIADGINRHGVTDESRLKLSKVLEKKRQIEILMDLADKS